MSRIVATTGTFDGPLERAPGRYFRKRYRTGKLGVWHRPTRAYAGADAEGRVVYLCPCGGSTVVDVAGGRDRVERWTVTDWATDLEDDGELRCRSLRSSST